MEVRKGDTIDAGLGNDVVDHDSLATSIDGGGGTDTLRILGSEDFIADFTVATNSQQIFVNTNGNFTALTSLVKILKM